MQNKILIPVGALVLATIIFFGVRHANLNTTELPVTSSTSTSTASSANSPEAKNVEKSAWSVFQNYLGYAKAHNFPGLKNVAYQTSDTCNDPTKTAACNTLMDSAYKIGIQFKESDFVNVWSDSKQIILSTNFHTEQSDIARALAREVIYFTRDSNGTPKVLSFTLPEEITYTLIDPKDKSASTTAAIDARLAFRVKDTDQDGLADEIENCSYDGAPKSCVQTNPNKRDSKGDGWWDGVRIFIKK